MAVPLIQIKAKTLVMTGKSYRPCLLPSLYHCPYLSHSTSGHLLALASSQLSLHKREKPALRPPYGYDLSWNVPPHPPHPPHTPHASFKSLFEYHLL